MAKEAEQEGGRRYYLVNTTPINETMNTLDKYFLTSPVMLDITKLPEIICLKYLAYYLALSSKKFLNFNDILWEDSSWLNNATRIHTVLRKTLEKKLDITLSYSIFSDQLRTAKFSGVKLIASVGSDTDISNRLTCDITRELAIELIKLLPEHNYLFIDNNNPTKDTEIDVGYSQNSIQNTKTTLIKSVPSTLKPSFKCHSRTLFLVQAVEQLLTNHPDHILAPYAIWKSLFIKKDDPIYKISKVQGGGAAYDYFQLRQWI